MDPSTVTQFMPLFQTLVWAVLVGIVVLGLRRELRKLIERLSGADDLQMSLGALKVQAKTMRELHKSIGASFPDETIRKEEVDALLDIKIKSIQAAIEHVLTKTETRDDPRVQINEKVRIIRHDGKAVFGTTIDVSEAGIGFKSDHRLRFGEVVKIKPRDTHQKIPGRIAEPMRIVRIEEAKDCYYYGATVSGEA